MVTSERAQASPTKAFFVEMLVKDVALDSAILDLLDNCIDGAKSLRGDGPYEGLSVEIVVNANEFRIADNCGGFDVETAMNYAFKFGTDPAAVRPDNALGVFGVGMKRAIFKIGRDVEVSSVSARDSFTMRENIPAWQRREDPDGWYFPLEVERFSEERQESERGTTISIKNLYDSVSRQLGSDFFAGSLQRSIASRHQHHLERGLTVTVNGKAIPATTVKFAFVPGSQLLPAFEERPLDGVAMRLYAGIGELNRPMAGWYIYCNGRMVVEHDQTELTGWGEDAEIAIPKYHHQFARFRGCVFFDSRDSSRLPWNTTKDGVDSGSEVYRSARVRMVSHMRAVIDFLNRLDGELEEPDESKRTLFSLLEDAEYRPPIQVPSAANFSYRAPQGRIPPRDVRVTISRPRSEVERLKKYLGARSNKAAVEKMFDWFMENVCPDAE